MSSQFDSIKLISRNFPLKVLDNCIVPSASVARVVSARDVTVEWAYVARTTTNTGVGNGTGTLHIGV